MPVSESIEFTYDIQILFSTILHSNVSTLPIHFEICGLLSKSEDYKFCPGLEEKPYFDNYYIIIFQIWEMLFTQIDSKDCLMWHQLSENGKLVIN